MVSVALAIGCSLPLMDWLIPSGLRRSRAQTARFARGDSHLAIPVPGAGIGFDIACAKKIREVRDGGSRLDLRGLSIPCRPDRAVEGGRQGGAPAAAQALARHGPGRLDAPHGRGL